MPAIVLLGPLPEPALLGDLAREFGWAAKHAADPDDLRALNAECEIVAVLFPLNAPGPHWREVLVRTRRAAPEAFLVVCHRFSDSVTSMDLRDAGVFYNLRLPFARVEVQQALGFVQEGWSRRTAKAASAGDFTLCAG
jgi:hypothetical protein